MAIVKEMPFSEKYTTVLDKIEREVLAPAFIEKHLGQPAVAELQQIYQKGVKPIPEEASLEEKYEIAYSNWIWIGRSGFSFVRERMGEDGIRQFVRAAVEAIKHQNASPALFLLRLIRAMSPGLAFTMVAKQTAYKLQWLSPYSVPELTRHRTVLSIPRCKILDFPGSEDLCVVGCQSVYPQWLAEQFKVKMEANRQGNSCTITLIPLG